MATVVKVVPQNAQVVVIGQPQQMMQPQMMQQQPQVMRTPFICVDRYIYIINVIFSFYHFNNNTSPLSFQKDDPTAAPNGRRPTTANGDATTSNGRRE